jgi:glutaredoxin
MPTGPVLMRWRKLPVDSSCCQSLQDIVRANIFMKLGKLKKIGGPAIAGSSSILKRNQRLPIAPSQRLRSIMPPDHAHFESRHQTHSTLPSLSAFWIGLAILVMQAFEGSRGIPGMPRFWHQNQAIWLGIGLVSFGWGCRQLCLLEAKEERKRPWHPTVPGRRFHEVVIYTRTNCPLCDEAADVLADHTLWLPNAISVDIDSDPRLQELFNTLVPVVVCDDKIRFRGRVDKKLLRRIIEGTPPNAW